MNDASDRISDLQSKWDTLHDLERAREIRAIHQSGTSLNEIAKALKRSPSLLRHLLQALQAPLEDLLLARKGKLTTNELARRGKAEKIRRAANHQKALEVRRTQESIAGCKAICDWLSAEGTSGPAGVQIVSDARWILDIAERDKTLPRDVAPSGTPLVEIIRRCRPAKPFTEDDGHVSWYARWLALWAAYSMTDSWVRYKAIELALEKQHRR